VLRLVAFEAVDALINSREKQQHVSDLVQRLFQIVEASQTLVSWRIEAR
jgi:hypothetical protein